MSAPTVARPILAAGRPAEEPLPVPQDRPNTLPVSHPLSDVEDRFLQLARWCPAPPPNPWPGVLDALEEILDTDGERALEHVLQRDHDERPSAGHLEQHMRDRKTHEALRKRSLDGHEAWEEQPESWDRKQALASAVDAATGAARARLVDRFIRAAVAHQQAFAQGWAEEHEECVRTLADLHEEWQRKRDARRAWPLLRSLRRATLARLWELDDIALNWLSGMGGQILPEYERDAWER